MVYVVVLEGYSLSVVGAWPTLGPALEAFKAEVVRPRLSDSVLLYRFDGVVSEATHWAPSWPRETWKVAVNYGEE